MLKQRKRKRRMKKQRENNQKLVDDREKKEIELLKAKRDLTLQQLALDSFCQINTDFEKWLAEAAIADKGLGSSPIRVWYVEETIDCCSWHRPFPRHVPD